MRMIKNFIHACLGLFACALYGFPSRGMTVIGITGTDGKTTTAHMMYSILKEQGFNVAMISTLGAVVAEKKYENGLHVTTPSAFTLQRYLQLAKKYNTTHVVLEITSHGLDQHRDIGIRYTIGILTNITHEHLDYHKTYENYVRTKLKLIQKAKTGIVNKEDMSYQFIISHFKSQISNAMTYGLSDGDITLKEFPVQTVFQETFNQYNALAAASVGKVLNLDAEIIMGGLKKFHPPVGRQEIVYDKDFTVMIDFAHTPNAFQMLLRGLDKQKKGRLIHIFGTAGERDHEKRPEMGKVSSEFCDVIILTAEDPRHESLDSINKEIINGFSKKFLMINDDKKLQKEKNIYTIIDNREQAIERAIGMAQKNDFIVITGKAHEKSMNFNGIEQPWDEFAAVKKALKKYKYE